MSVAAAGFILREVKRHPSLILCPATGNTPTRTYELLAKTDYNFKGVQLLALDEWGDIDPDDPASCSHYLNTQLISPLGIQFALKFTRGEDGISQTTEFLKAKGPIDLCILGMGKNGHLGFNEPGPSLEPQSHKAKLSSASKNHAMLSDHSFKPAFGYTLGMADILQAKSILLLVNGAHKKSIFQKFLTKKITTELPASFLWLHPNVTCITTTNIWD